MPEENDQKNGEDDVVVEADENLDDSVVAEEAIGETIKKLRLKLKEAEKKSADYLAGWQRTQADFINYKKREAEEKESFLKYATEPIVLDIIEVMDSFESAFNNKEHWEKADKSWRDGVTQIYNQLKKALEKNDVSIDDPLGKDFEPVSHLAVQMVSVEKEENDGKIVEVVQKGYLLHGRVIRPAKVKVGQMLN